MTRAEKKSPKISIGFPVRNGGQYVAAALRSVLDQTEQDFEIIISDNCSDDGTSALLKSAAAADVRLRYFRQDQPLRAYDNFRFVLHEAHGEFFMWMAHDDTRDPDFVARLIAALEGCPEAVLAFGEVNLITPEDSVGHIISFPFQTTGMSLAGRLYKVSRLQCFHIYGVWRTSALRQVPYAYCAWWPDLPMMLAAAVLGEFVYVPAVHFHYLEFPKTNLDRVKAQDYRAGFNLVYGVLGLIAATYRACANVGGVMVGFYAALLIILKQIGQFPGFVLRRIRKMFRTI